MADVHPTGAILGSTEQIEALRSQIRRLAAFDTPGSPHVPTVLLQGETGTGKGLIARVIHDSGPRAGGPFVDVNCAAIPETMLEAELFGFEAGAFTDAKRAKPGLFEAASAGTLFLDEIDSLPLTLQSKLLKAIEEKRIRRLGAVAPRDVDVKLVAATQKDLKALAGAGEFRPDLYHRLAVVVVSIPALRERAGDILPLAEHFLRWYAEAHGLAPKRLDAGATAWLRDYDWPGNVRELAHLMERVTLLSPNDVIERAPLEALWTAPPAASRSQLAAPRRLAPAGVPDDAADTLEAARIGDALARSGGNVVRAARALGIGRNALRYRIRRLGIERADDADVRKVEADGVAELRPPPRRGAVATAPPAAWEQKPVAVLAISLTFPATEDAVGYEPWTAATRWERAIAERVEGFGGVFLQRSPSRLTAGFGIPRALEQMAERAAQSALAIQRAIGQAASPRPEFRAAVHVGEVRIDVAAADPLARLLPLGDAFALPERLLGHTGGGEVVVSAQVGRRLERTCELAARTLQLGPGDADRLTAFVVSGQRTPAASEGAADTPTTFVGRERELDLLGDAFARAAAGHGQVVFVAGEAGIGKSRLLVELRRRLTDAPHRWIEGRCASYGAATPFFALIDALRRYFGIDDHDDEASASAKIVREVERLGVELAWTVPFVQQVLSLNANDHPIQRLDSASRRSELSRAMAALLARGTAIEPAVIAIEDVHWIDPASEEFLVFLNDIVPTTPVLLVLSHRTGYRQPFGDRTYHVRAALSPLSGRDMAVMTDSMLGVSDIPLALRELIAQRAEGNPFFVEELTRSLVESGALRKDDERIVLARPLDDITVPGTIQDVLIARIDRLAAESRQAIQVASVIGREFALRLLARISEAGDRIQGPVDELRSLELIYEKPRQPELAYMFKHALTHDVAYESVRGERRTLLHRAIGLAIEELYADRLAEHYETLALHFGRGEEWQRALRYHELSAEKASETHANRAVADHCRQALAIAERLRDAVPDETRQSLNQRLGQACFYLSEFAASATAYEHAAAQSAVPETRALYLAAAAASHFWGHQYEAAWRRVNEALDLSRQHDSAAGEGMARAVLGFYRGVHDADLVEFEAQMRTTLALSTRHANEHLECVARVHLAQAAEWTCDYRTAVAHAERAIALARQHKMADYLIFATWFLGKARCCIGDYGGAIGLLDESYQICHRIGDRAWKSRLLNTLGWCLAEIGNTERARHYNTQAAELARELGDPEILSNADINLAMNHLARGAVDEALRYLEPLEQQLAIPGDPWMRWRYALHACHVRARLELVRGEPERALGCIETELEGARRHRIPKVEARALSLRASALLALGRHGEAQATLCDALAIAERIGYRHAQWEAHRLLAETARRLGNPAKAAEHTAQSRALAEAAARTLADGELREVLIASVVAAN